LFVAKEVLILPSRTVADDNVVGCLPDVMDSKICFQNFIHGLSAFPTGASTSDRACSVLFKPGHR